MQLDFSILILSASFKSGCEMPMLAKQPEALLIFKFSINLEF